ncbi:hypothetical protein GIB67_003498 [Kingdonia uniflora]|uniref:Trichome birefringence-like N-terminal domain-containing protein n=1 Tax=Kingdonia uniflora TaxID=39325 RepID=A0A7J7MF00_9MAGN|nr:hypothetical protein GIB67_003498 [Kingdonia uniflora]
MRPCSHPLALIISLNVAEQLFHTIWLTRINLLRCISVAKKVTPGIQDCLHWCQPSVPDTWNEILYAHCSEHNTMKGGLYGLRRKQISLILISLFCTSIVLWEWERSPFLIKFIPPQNHVLRPSLEVLMGTPGVSSMSSETDVLVKNDTSNSFLEGEITTHEDIKKIDTVAPIGSSTANTPQNNNTETKPKASLIMQKGCNLAKGKWIKDSRRPLYSGFGCKRWLSEMWACRLTQRKDFSYEKLRWQPNNCKMPEFEASSFLRRMRGKTIAFVGDSLGRQQFQSLMCMATGSKDSPGVIDVGKKYGLIKARGTIRPAGWAYRFKATNTTILFYWSTSLCEVEPLNITNPATHWALHLDRPPSFLTRYIHRFDVLVLNTGHHWNRGKFNTNRWVMHVGGVPNTNRKLINIGNAKNFKIYSIIKWLDSELPKHPRLKAFFRTISPRHFFNGDWNSGGSCDNTVSLVEGKEITQDESSDTIVSGAVNGTKVNMLDITAISQLRDEGHLSRFTIKVTPGVQDCLHWCQPGVPDTWNEILYAQL